MENRLEHLFAIFSPSFLLEIVKFLICVYSEGEIVLFEGAGDEICEVFLLFDRVVVTVVVVARHDGTDPDGDMVGALPDDRIMHIKKKDLFLLFCAGGPELFWIGFGGSCGVEMGLYHQVAIGFGWDA